jgi:tripartite-type tricarboxylate transporter receptor subunit TctC
MMRFAVALLLAIAAPLGHAFPDKPVRFVVAAAREAPADVLARALSEELAGRWKQQVVVENRPGAGGNIAAARVAKSAPDGHTWLLGNNRILATNAALYRSLPYDPVRDFTPVALVAVQPEILVVHPNVPARSVSDLIDYLRRNPGTISYASPGGGAAAHLTGELFKLMADVEMVHVPYKGAQLALDDLVAGQAQVMFAAPASAIPYIKAGQLRALAVTTARRSPAAPGLPTVWEAGLPGFEAATWQGVVVPAATPAALVQELNRELNSVLREKELGERFAALGAEVATGTPRDFAAYIARQIPKWAKVVEDSGARAE